MRALMIPNETPSPPDKPGDPVCVWPEGLTIRATAPGDAKGIVELQSQPTFRAGTLRLPYPSLAGVEQRLQQHTNTAVSLVGLMDGRLVAHGGFSRHEGRRSHAASLGMGVHDAYSGRGIGSALMGEMIDIADNWMNLRRLELTVFVDNEPAIKLYRRFGFEIEGTLAEFAFRAGQFVDAYSMARIRPAL